MIWREDENKDKTIGSGQEPEEKTSFGSRKIRKRDKRNWRHVEQYASYCELSEPGGTKESLNRSNVEVFQ